RGGERGGRVIQRLGGGGCAARDRPHRRGDSLRLANRPGLSLHGHEGAGPTVARRSREDPRRVDGGHLRARRLERPEDGRGQGAADVKGEPPSESVRERTGYGPDRVIGYGDRKHLALAAGL